MALSAKSREKGISKIRKRIKPVADANPFVKLLVYGRSGSGKTRLAASGPKPLIVDVNEEGTRSVRNYPDAYVVSVEKWEEIHFVYWMLKEGDHDYETVIIDTLTQLQHMCMRHVLNEAEDRDPNRPPSMPRHQDWGQLGELMKPLMLDFRNLPLNVVFVCQERVDKNGEEEDEEVTVRRVPDLSPSVRGVAMASVEVMGRIYRKKVRTVVTKTVKGKEKRVQGSKWETRLLVGPHDEFETKDRTGGLGHIVQNPTMDIILKASFESQDPVDE